MNSFTASTHGRRNGLLEFAIVLKPKNNKKKFQRGNAMAANENVRTLGMCLYSLFFFLRQCFCNKLYVIYKEGNTPDQHICKTVKMEEDNKDQV